MGHTGWIGFAKPRPVDALALLMLTDTGTMAWWVRLDRMRLTPTLDDATHVQTEFSIVDADGLVLIRSGTGRVRDGYPDWGLEVWASDGTLACYSRQMLAMLD